MAVRIPLTRGYVAVVDDCDGDLARLKWHAQTNRNGTTYASRTVRMDGRRLHIYLHRIIAERMYGEPLDTHVLVDHIDGVGTCCLRSNLRKATKSQNTANQRRKNGAHKGVFFSRSSGKWRASIMVNYRQIYLGTYDSKEGASEAYKAAALAHFGEFANVEGD